MCGLEKLGLVDQNWSERNFSALLLRTLVVGRRQQSESIEAALDVVVVIPYAVCVGTYLSIHC